MTLNEYFLPICHYNTNMLDNFNFPQIDHLDVSDFDWNHVTLVF
jgi:hypothetical protein